MRTDRIDGDTLLYAIIGDPISAVRSPDVFNSMFARQDVNAVMIALHVATGDLETAWAGMRRMRNLAGVVFTMPHKFRAAALVDVVSATGSVVGAINAARREADGSWSGDMFDGRGFVSGLVARGHSVAGKVAFLLGAGGAGVAIAAALAEAGVRSIVIDDVNRNRRDDAIRRVHDAFPSLTVKSGSIDSHEYDLAINATPLGMRASDPLPFDPSNLPRSTTVIDIITKPEMTPLLVAAETCGHRVHTGRHMHHGQAIEAARFFGFTLEGGADRSSESAP